MISHSQVECLIEIIYWKKISHFQVLYIIIFYSPFYLRPSCCLKRNVWNLITTRRKKVRRKLLFGLYPKLLCSDDDSLSCHGPIQLHVESQSRLFDRGVNKKGRNWSLSKLKNLFTRVVIRCWKATVQTPFTSSSTSRVCPWHVPSTYFLLEIEEGSDSTTGYPGEPSWEFVAV